MKRAQCAAWQDHEDGVCQGRGSDMMQRLWVEFHTQERRAMSAKTVPVSHWGHCAKDNSLVSTLATPVRRRGGRGCGMPAWEPESCQAVGCVVASETQGTVVEARRGGMLVPESICCYLGLLMIEKEKSSLHSLLCKA